MNTDKYISRMTNRGLAGILTDIDAEVAEVLETVKALEAEKELIHAEQNRRRESKEDTAREEASECLSE